VESSHAEIFKFSSSSSSLGMLPVFDQFILSKTAQKAFRREIVYRDQLSRLLSDPISSLLFFLLLQH
jgi:hypothetical protein